LVVIGLLGGGTATVDLRALMNKRARVVGTTLRARPLEEKIAATRHFARRVVPWLERGLVRPVVDRVFAFEDVRAAEQRLEANFGFGKIVLRV
jgi:NADPH:quinone reductase-like Zn-dependent oxidoreductase